MVSPALVLSKKSSFMKPINKLIIIMSIVSTELFAQVKPELSALPSLPSIGWAGMYAGTSKGVLFCMGGTNFPDKKPWEGGKRNVSKEIYMLSNNYSNWIKLNEELPQPMAYGVSATYGNQIILVGGTAENGMSAQIIVLEWDGEKLNKQHYPDFPVPIAYASGTVVGNLLIVAGGMDLAGNLSKKCYALNLLNPKNGWLALPDLPGRERMLAICGAFGNKFYLFSGETKTKNLYGEIYRDILQDAYKLNITEKEKGFSFEWEALAKMPKGMSAGATPVPVLNNETMFFWGGVDAVAGLHKVPATHPGISKEIFNYYPDQDKWEFVGEIKDISAKVTLPVVYWNNQWVYVSGEIKPGIRDNAVIGIEN